MIKLQDWRRFKETKPIKDGEYICCCMLTDFTGGDYLLDQMILKWDNESQSFDCDGISVLFWTDTPEWPTVLRLEPDEDDIN